MGQLTVLGGNDINLFLNSQAESASAEICSTFHDSFETQHGTHQPQTKIQIKITFLKNGLITARNSLAVVMILSEKRGIIHLGTYKRLTFLGTDLEEII